MQTKEYKYAIIHFKPGFIIFNGSSNSSYAIVKEDNAWNAISKLNDHPGEKEIVVSKVVREVQLQTEETFKESTPEWLYEHIVRSEENVFIIDVFAR